MIIIIIFIVIVIFSPLLY